MRKYKKSMDEVERKRKGLGRRCIEKTCSEIFSHYLEAKCAYLFDSYVRKTATGKNDVDI
jgi:hypothetical protein